MGAPPALAILLRASLQRDLAETSRHVEAGHAFDADRLQRDLVAVAADQHVGAKAEANRGVSGRTGILAGQRALRHLARGEHRPDHVALGSEADVDAVFLDLAVIALGGSIRLGEDAADVL